MLDYEDGATSILRQALKNVIRLASINSK